MIIRQPVVKVSTMQVKDLQSPSDESGHVTHHSHWLSCPGSPYLAIPQGETQLLGKGGNGGQGVSANSTGFVSHRKPSPANSQN